MILIFDWRMQVWCFRFNDVLKIGSRWNEKILIFKDGGDFRFWLKVKNGDASVELCCWETNHGRNWNYRNHPHNLKQLVNEKFIKN